MGSIKPSLWLKNYDLLADSLDDYYTLSEDYLFSLMNSVRRNDELN